MEENLRAVESKTQHFQHCLGPFLPLCSMDVAVPYRFILTVAVQLCKAQFWNSTGSFLPFCYLGSSSSVGAWALILKRNKRFFSRCVHPSLAQFYLFADFKTSFFSTSIRVSSQAWLPSSMYFSSDFNVDSLTAPA